MASISLAGGLPGSFTSMSAFGSVLIAAIVAYVAWQQWRDARSKLALELFDRRFAVYQRLSEALNQRHSDCHNHATPFELDVFRWRDFNIASRDAGLLFGKDVMTSIKKMDESLGDLEALHDRYLRLGVLVDHLIDQPEFRAANGAYIDASVNFERHIRAYMYFGHIGRSKPKRPLEWEK